MKQPFRRVASPSALLALSECEGEMRLVNVRALASFLAVGVPAISHYRDAESQGTIGRRSRGQSYPRQPRLGWQRCFRSLILAFLVLAFSVAGVKRSFAQEETTRGKIAGTIRDSAGKPIVGARVQVISKLKDTHYDLVTDQNGHYESTWLMESPDYIVRTEARNFRV